MEEFPELLKPRAIITIGRSEILKGIDTLSGDSVREWISANVSPDRIFIKERSFIPGNVGGNLTVFIYLECLGVVRCYLGTRRKYWLFC